MPSGLLGAGTLEGESLLLVVMVYISSTVRIHVIDLAALKVPLVSLQSHYSLLHLYSYHLEVFNRATIY